MMPQLRDVGLEISGQEDLGYVSHGPRTFCNGEERRKLERELLKLVHEGIPKVDRWIDNGERHKGV